MLFNYIFFYLLYISLTEEHLVWSS